MHLNLHENTFYEKKNGVYKKIETRKNQRRLAGRDRLQLSYAFEGQSPTG